MAVGDTSDRYDPYADYLPNDLKLKTKIGLLYAWKARAQQYLAEENPLATYRTVDENKFAWTLKDIYHDPMGTVIGRYIISEEEIEAKLIWKDQQETAMAIKKSSDYMRIGVIETPLSGRFKTEDDFEKQLVYARLSNNFQPLMEVEGEVQYDRRNLWDVDYFLHRVSMGWYKWDPHNSRTTAPGRVGYSTGARIIEKPVSGPNIRGRYARDLRGDKDVIYEFTNLSDYSNLGSDDGRSMYNIKSPLMEKYIKNKFLGKEELSPYYSTLTVPEGEVYTPGADRFWTKEEAKEE